MTPAQNQIQDHLLRKHEELQKLIVQQQDELRKVSEQLFMARYGIIPSIVNVSVPYSAPVDPSDVGDGCMSTSSHASHSTYHEQHLHMLNPSHMQSQSQANPQLQNPNSILHQQHPHIPIHYELHPQKPSQVEQSMDADQQNDDIMQYMQHQSQPIQPTNPHQMLQPQQQQIMNNDDFELMPFQLMNQQAQILFSSGSNNESANHSSSNK